MKGICCTCQSPHPVRNAPPDDLDDESDDPKVDPAADQLMIAHDMWGQRCEGSGTTPQALVDN